MNASKPIFLIGISILIMSVFFSSISAMALTQSEKAEQLAQREKALQKMKEVKTTDVINYKKDLNLITISLDKTCLKFVKNGLKSKCPTYDQIVSLDNTPKYAGVFVNDTWYHRTTPSIKNWYNWLPEDQTIICVDCQGSADQLAKYNIVLVLKLDYKLDKDHKITDNIRYLYHNRYVENCQTAKIVYSEFLLSDTISYLKSGCSTTDFNEKETIIMNKTKHDIKTTQAYKNQKFIQEAKKLKYTNCLKSETC